MHASKLLKYIATLSQEELNKFHTYVHKSSRKQSVLVLIDLIKSCFPNLNSRKLEIQRVSKALYPKAEFRANAIRKAMTEILKLLEEHWITQTCLDDPQMRSKALRTNLLERELYTAYQKEAEQRLKEIKLDEAISAVEHDECHKIYEELSYEQRYLKKADFGNLHQQATDHMAIGHILEIQTYLISMKQAQLTRRTPLPKFLEWYDTHPKIIEIHAVSNKNIQLLHLLNQAMTRPTESLCNETFDYLKSNVKNISQETKYFSLIILLGLIRAYESKGLELNRKAIIEWGIANNGLTRNGQLDLLTLTDYVSELCRSNNFNAAFDLVKNTMSDFSKRLYKPFYYLNIGRIHYYKKEYKQGYENLIEAEFGTYGSGEIARREVLVLCLFNLLIIDDSLSEILEYQLINTNKYIQRNKEFSKGKKLRYSAMLKLQKTLLKYYNQKTYSSSLRLKLLKDINKEINISELSKTRLRAFADALL